MRHTALPGVGRARRCIIYTVEGAQAEFIRMKSTSKKRTPSVVNLTVKRRYLTQREIERLMDYAASMAVTGIGMRP